MFDIILKNILFVVEYVDITSTAGGNHLTFISLMRMFIADGMIPTLYIQNDPHNKTRNFFSSLGCKVLSLEAAQSFASKAGSLTYIYGWGANSARLVELLSAKKYVIRPSALGYPLCSSALKQKNGCWNNCNVYQYFLHANKTLRGTIDAVRGFLGKSAWENALELNFPAARVIDLYKSRFPQLKNKKCTVTHECIEIDNSIKEKFAWEKMPTANPALLLVSKWELHKGLLDVLPYLKDNFEIFILGSGSEAEKGKHLFTGPNIHWLGHVEHAKLFDRLPERRFLYLHPARWFEVHGRTTVESMLAGMPILVPSDSGAAYEFSNTQYIYKYNRIDLKLLPGIINKIFSIPRECYTEQTQVLSQEAARFSIHAVYKEWVEYFQKLRA